MEVGKLPPELLAELLAKVRTDDSRVLIGPGVGEDAAVLDMGDDRVLVAKTDPITFATGEIGWYAVHVNANDVAASGATPRWFLATLLAPESVTSEQIATIFGQITDACRSLGVTLIGGHTEITYDLERPIIVGMMLGEARRSDITATSAAEPGDRIILTKGIAIEGTSVLARDASDALIRRGVTRETIEQAREYLYDPGISVVADATTARASATVHCMHDPTEGGLITGLQEIAVAAGVGVRIDETKIPVLTQTRQFCDALALDPLGLLASGALVMTVPEKEARPLLRGMEAKGISAYDIGEVVHASDGRTLLTTTGEREMPTFDRDELARFFSSQRPD